MKPLDWAIVAAFFAASIALGLAVQAQAGKSLASYFVSNRRMGWWLAGTSMAATAFSSDTPLLITGMIRRRGVWGVWEVWALGISTMLAVFVFAKLWRRANVMTEVELVELRYSGRAASFLRGFKAVYWGLLYNSYIIGVWPVIGMTKMLQEIIGVSRTDAIIGSVLLGTLYTSMSGLWGVVLTDAFQFVWAMIGAFLLAGYAVQAVGGLPALTARLQGTAALDIIPPLPDAGQSLLSSPFGWFLGLLCVQWWAWKNTDGGGIVVQRLVSCKDERHAMASVLWFNIAHHCIRSWPWVITALASIVLIPDALVTTTAPGGVYVDHERAYPRLVTLLLPAGIRGVLVASFFAAFLSTISSQLNWGASYLLNDLYKRFLRPQADERHHLRVARALPWLIAAAGLAVAFANWDIGASFTWILNLTAGIGPVYLLRWVWWRINPWSEIAAMVASLPVLLLRPHALGWLGLPGGLLPELLFMVAGTALVWLPATLATPPVERRVLDAFYARVRPPGWWPQAAGVVGREAWGFSLMLWLLSTVALLATTVGPLMVLLRPSPRAWLVCAAAGVGWLAVWLGWSRTPRAREPAVTATAASPG